MKWISFIMATGVALLVCGPAGAQVEVALNITPSRALVFEPLRAEVVIRNNTGGVLAFDASRAAARLFLEVERGKDEALRPVDRTPLLFGTSLAPFEVRTNRLDLTSLYVIQTPGVYKVRAGIEWQDRLFAARAVEVEISKGLEIARIIAGIPGEPAALRVYILEYLGKPGGEDIYLRIEDENSKTVYGMFNLGRIVRVRKPEMKLDEAGNVHVLFQSLSMVFVHAAFTPYGVPLFCRNYTDRSNTIALLSLPNGQVAVSPRPPPAENKAAGLPVAPAANAARPEPAEKPRLGRGGLFGPKPE